MLYLAENDENENRANYLRNSANNLYQYLQAQYNQPTEADYLFYCSIFDFGITLTTLNLAQRH